MNTEPLKITYIAAACGKESLQKLRKSLHHFAVSPAIKLRAQSGIIPELWVVCTNGDITGSGHTVNELRQLGASICPVGKTWKNNHDFNLSQIRNHSLNLVKQGFCSGDLIALVDSDFYPHETPLRLGWASIPTGFAKFAITDCDLDRPGLINKRFIGPGWFLLAKSLILSTDYTIRFDEDYSGYGYEDFDFEHVVLRQQGIVRSSLCPPAYHVRHDLTLGNLENATFDRYMLNRRRLLERMVASTMDSGIRPDPRFHTPDFIEEWAALLLKEFKRRHSLKTST